MKCVTLCLVISCKTDLLLIPDLILKLYVLYELFPLLRAKTYQESEIEYNLIANRKFTCCYNINNLNRLWGKYTMYVIVIQLCMKRYYFIRLKENNFCKTYNLRIKNQKGAMVFLHYIWYKSRYIAVNEIYNVCYFH